MKKFKFLRNLFITLSLILSHIMCADTAFNYAGMLCGIEHKGFSAPANVALILAVPYGIGIVVCVILAIIFDRKCR